MKNLEESKTEDRLAYRFDIGRGEAWYVSSLPELQSSGNNVSSDAKEKGRYCDFGYVDKIEKALPLSPYWQRRFRKDLERCNHTPHFIAQPKGEQ